MMNRRIALAAAIVLAFLVLWHVPVVPDYSAEAWKTAKTSFSGSLGSSGSSTDLNKPSPPRPPYIDDSRRIHIETYFEQVFSAEDPAPLYNYPALRQACAAADWADDAPYLNCIGMDAGITSVVSQIKVCLKMAVETGSHLLLPKMPLRDSNNLEEFNFLNQDAYMAYDKWFDLDHLRRQLSRTCPRMKIRHPDELVHDVVVNDRFSIMCTDAPGYVKLHSFFWVGRPFAPFFREMLQTRRAEARAAAKLSPPAKRPPKDGITVVDTDSEFMVFRITDDPTGRELRLWNDLAHLVRFRTGVRRIIDRLLQQLPPNSMYYGVHFRAENDSIWSSAEHQLAVDLDALDRAWNMYGGARDDPPQPKPPVYLACGDAAQVERFAAAGAARGWNVTHKWRLAAAADAGAGRPNADAAGVALDDQSTLTSAINDLPFDFQGAVDMGIMMRSRFFIGLQGSAFSSTIGNMRDVTGRYRGSSFDNMDEGAHTHLFNDVDATEYACCL